MDPSTHLEHLQADIERIRATPLDRLDEAVAACPGWSLADLFAHHAGVFRFVVAQLRAEPGSDLVPFDPHDAGVAPPDLLPAAPHTPVAAPRAAHPTRPHP